MDVLKARIMEAAPGEVQGVISSVQFVPRAAAFTSLIQMPNTFSYSALISALARAGRWQEAERYFQELAAKAQRHPDMQPNTVTYAALISAYEKGGQLDRALAAFERQLAADVAPDLITYSSLITACERAGSLGQASCLLDQLHGSGLVGNHQLYHGLLSACQVAGRWELAVEVFLGMQCATMRPTAHTVGLLLGTLCEAGQAGHALCLLCEALRGRYELGPSAYHAVLQLLAGLGDWRAALGVYRAMQLVKAGPDASSAGLIVAACMHGGNQALAAQLAGEFVAQGLLQPAPPPGGPTNGSAAEAPADGPAAPAAHASHPQQQHHHQAQYRRSGSSGSSASTAAASVGGLGSTYSIASPRSSATASPKA
ncbi:hypothetical protein CHLNCDRAFT_133694 [Chlorella variabilis]|uniref:Pentacotripeptide-repeat region of PRORP domain-containing protein n=1 Tax=Chlorella variabilis TaxID=554065 RepID=E1Z3L2_CHLVA|nr:hypothetical protein CHLNCDRAFT_133694 [Chlorella variabilis]EFN59867.1 hypothetical protein CHLNCDRAFT_133694 [Chlorella variabilis]|eukprot:XP_005851969.1 hypothetical protein CHLNCDRAFT_133694 [Chlorella variabilis]